MKRGSLLFLSACLLSSCHLQGFNLFNHWPTPCSRETFIFWAKALEKIVVSDYSHFSYRNSDGDFCKGYFAWDEKNMQAYRIIEETNCDIETSFPSHVLIFVRLISSLDIGGTYAINPFVITVDSSRMKIRYEWNNEGQMTSDFSEYQGSSSECTYWYSGSMHFYDSESWSVEIVN